MVITYRARARPLYVEHIRADGAAVLAPHQDVVCSGSEPVSNPKVATLPGTVVGGQHVEPRIIKFPMGVGRAPCRYVMPASNDHRELEVIQVVADVYPAAIGAARHDWRCRPRAQAMIIAQRASARPLHVQDVRTDG